MTTAEFCAFLDEMDQQMPRSPLRMYMQRINYDYAAVREQNEDWEEKHIRAAALVDRRRQEWRDWCTMKYPVWMTLMPNQLVEIGGGN